MSDFGALIVFEKSGTTLSDKEKQDILEIIKDIISSGNFSSHISEKDYSKLYEWDENKLCLKLTEYYNDDDRDEIWEFASEEDGDEAQEIVDLIRPQIEENVIISVVFTDW